MPAEWRKGKPALNWNLQGTWGKRLKQTWRRTILEAAGKCSKTSSKVASLAGKKIR
jgi:hypothetical protein